MIVSSGASLAAPGLMSRCTGPAAWAVFPGPALGKGLRGRAQPRPMAAGRPVHFGGVRRVPVSSLLLCFHSNTFQPHAERQWGTWGRPLHLLFKGIQSG